MNNYDDVQLNINQLLTEQQRALPSTDASARSADNLTITQNILSHLQFYTTALLYKLGIHKRLVYANLKLGWFYEFRDYWMNELGLRRIEPHDFYHLAGIYRQKFQALEVADTASNDQFLTAWQHPASIHLLFAYQYKQALHPIATWSIAQHIPHNANICEYGCGIAPITHNLCTYHANLNIRITCADIPSYMLHFARWKFRDKQFVRVLPIDPASDHPLDEQYDVITCITVLEHLPRPLSILQHLHERLKPGGYFIFDYIKSEGSGLDTQASLQNRDAVLTFIRHNFTIVKGTLPTDNSDVKLVISQKK